MPEAAAAAVKHHHDLVRNRDPKFFRELLVAHVLRPRDLHFQIMIAAAERADLVVAALNCALADFRCVGAGDAAVLLGKFKILLPAEPRARRTSARLARPGLEIRHAIV